MNTKNYHYPLLQYFRGWILYPCRAFDFFSRLILLQLRKYSLLVTQTQCLGRHKIVENGSSSINMNISHTFLLSSCRVWISFSHGAIFFPLDWYFPRHANFYFPELTFKVGKCLYLHKYEELPHYFPLNCRLWILLYHKSLCIFPWKTTD